MTPKKNTSGPQIRKFREAEGLSQEQLAGRAQRAGWDIGRSVVAKIEAGSRRVTDAELMKFAGLLNTSPNELLRFQPGASA